MSANQKELREARQAERREKKNAAMAEQAKKDTRYRRNAVIVVAILVVLFVGAILINSDIFYTKTTAMTVGTTKYSPAEVSYFYRSTYNSVYSNLSQNLGSMASMMLDTTQPLSEQPSPYSTDGEETWADTISASAKDEMVRITSFYDAAVKAGRSLTDEEKSVIDQTIDGYKQYAASSGFASVDKFLSAYFGKGVNERMVRKLQEKIVIASDYYSEINDSFTYTDDELLAYYGEHANELDYYDYYTYSIYSTMSQFDDLGDDDDAKKQKVHEAAEAITAAATDAESFIAAVRDFTGEDTQLNVTINTAENIAVGYQDWITDAARQPGDTTVFDSGNTSYAIYFIGRDNNDYHTADFRHILVMAEADEDGNYTDEALFAARAKAEELLAQWKENPTEENFAAMANENSEDSGSNTNGGLYEQVTKYTMVPGVNDFLFAEGRAAGDTDVVFGQSSGYTGYHVMYYVGDNTLNSLLLAENAKRTEDITAKADEIAAGYDVVEKSAMRFVAEL